VSADQRYTPEDLALAEELARRAAGALESARPFRSCPATGREGDETHRQARLKERRQALAGLRAIAARARCLLWYADVEDRGEPDLRWTLRVADEEAARRFLPVDVPPEHTYSMALSDARLPEDRARMKRGDEEVRAGRSYHQEFRIRAANGWAVRRLFRPRAPGSSRVGARELRSFPGRRLSRARLGAVACLRRSNR
jgi:GAF domain-containing protein